MHASTSVRQSVIKPRTSSNTSPKRNSSSPLDISVNPSRLHANPWSTVRAHPAQPDRNKYKAHVPLIDLPESSASPPACICSPTTHVGSFRCRLHRETQKRWPNAAAASTSPAKASLEDEIFCESRITSPPGSRVPRVHAVTGFPEVAKDATAPGLSASATGPVKSEIPISGISGIHKSATTSELTSSTSFNSPTKTSRLRKMVSAENLLKIESAYEEGDLN